MAALGPVLQLAERASAPLPMPSNVADFMLPPPAPPPNGLPPPDSKAPAADEPFTIQTIAVDDNVAPHLPSAIVVEVTPTPTAIAVPPPPPPPPPPHLSSSQPANTEPQGDEKGPGNTQPPPSGECRLMGRFAIFIQLGLGGLALLSLVYKRWRERPQRPVKIWFFDVSKQVFGSVLVHMSNVFLSLLTSGRFSMKLVPPAMKLLRRDGDGTGGGNDAEPYMPNPCSFYLLNLAIDTTIGIPILIFLLHLITALVRYTPLGQPPESVQSGNYGRPPNAWWWLKQSIIYFCGLFGMKICVLIIFLTLPWISRVGDWALRWTEGNEQLQIIFAMMLFPLIMNALQYYIIDGFIKEQPTASPTAHHAHGGQYDHLTDSADDEGSDTDGGDSDDDVYIGSMSSSTSNELESGIGGGHNMIGSGSGDDASRWPPAHITDEITARRQRADSIQAPAPGGGVSAAYIAERDGNSPTIIGSSSSQKSRQTVASPPSLTSKEQLYTHD